MWGSGVTGTSEPRKSLGKLMGHCPRRGQASASSAQLRVLLYEAEVTPPKVEHAAYHRVVQMDERLGLLVILLEQRDHEGPHLAEGWGHRVAPESGGG